MGIERNIAKNNEELIKKASGYLSFFQKRLISNTLVSPGYNANLETTGSLFFDMADIFLPDNKTLLFSELIAGKTIILRSKDTTTSYNTLNKLFLNDNTFKKESGFSSSYLG
jgi:hypothetical protein